MTFRKRFAAVAACSIATALLGRGTVEIARAQVPPPPPPVPATPLPAASATPLPVSSGSAVPTASESPASPSTSPTPGASPTGAPTPTPLPTALPSGVAKPIRLDRARIGIVPGGTLVVDVSGGTGALVARSTSPSVDATIDASAHRLTLFARTAGTATVAVTDAFGDSASVDVLVAPPAGVVPHDVTVELGGNASPAFAIARATDEIVRQAQQQPKTTIDVHGIALPFGLRPGDRPDATARVKIDGGGVFVDALGTTIVHFRDGAYPKLDPQVLLYSDDPERLDANADGVLLRATVDVSRPARAYVYHVSDTPDRRLYLALQSTAGDARVQLLGYSAGPENAFSFVGHRSTLQYLLERGAQESVVVDVPADAPLLVPLGGRPMRAGDLVASIFDLRIVSGASMTATVVSVTGDRDPVEVLGGPELPGDSHGRRGEFSLVDVPPLALTFGIGAAEPAPFAIGAPTIANLRAGGRPLGGDYGVLREVALQLTNPSSSPATAYFYEQPAGGNATTTLWFTGDPTPTEIPCVKGSNNRYTVKRFDLAPGETRSVTGEYMTDGTSYFPLFFGVTATPPSPPPGPYSADACNPKAPPPGATPSPSASPTAPASPLAPNATASAIPTAAASATPAA